LYNSLPQVAEGCRDELLWSIAATDNNLEKIIYSKVLDEFMAEPLIKTLMNYDFGLWKKLRPEHLICPLDVHVAHVAHRFGLIATVKADWNNSLLLTEQLRLIDKKDPSQFDYALFGLGAEERF
jgi:hypothetical protein